MGRVRVRERFGAGVGAVDELMLATDTGILLNAGSGSHYVEGWLNVDVNADHRADVYADLSGIPLADGCVRWVFASHVLEHLDYHHGLPVVLAEFYRVLADDGELCVVGPDIERAVASGEPSPLLRAIIAWPSDFNLGDWPTMKPPMGHAWTATAPFVEAALSAAGFVCESYCGRLREIAVAGWPLENFGDWQNGFICRKKDASHVDQ